MRARHRLGGVVGLAAAATLLVACGASSGGGDAAAGSTSMTMSMPATSAGAGSSSAAAAGSTTITIANFDFGPPITVKAGATVTVVNTDSAPHDGDSDDHTSFNTEPISKGTFTFTAPTTPGVYKFHCSVHPDMHGSLTVTA